MLCLSVTFVDRLGLAKGKSSFMIDKKNDHYFHTN